MAPTWREERPDAITAASHSDERPSRFMVTMFSALSSSRDVRMRSSRSLGATFFTGAVLETILTSFFAGFFAGFGATFGASLATGFRTGFGAGFLAAALIAFLTAFLTGFAAGFLAAGFFAAFFAGFLTDFRACRPLQLGGEV